MRRFLVPLSAALLCLAALPAAAAAQSSDLGVSVSDSPDPVGPDQNVTYTVSVSNAGPNAATSATLSVVNSGKLRFQSVTSPAGWTCSPPAVGAVPDFSCSNSSLAPGATSSFTVVLRASRQHSGNQDATLSTSFAVDSSTADPVGANNSETENTAYNVPDANVSVTATDSPDPVSPGQVLTYSVNVANNGPDAAQGVTLTVLLASALRFASITAPGGWSCTTPAVGANGTITCSLATLASAGTGAFTINASVDPGATGGGSMVTNFLVTTQTNDPVPSNNDATVDTSLRATNPDLSVTLAGSPDPVTRGDTLTYTVTVSNPGAGAAYNATLTGVLPAGLTLVSVVTTRGACGPHFACTFGPISAGASETVVFTVRVGAGAADQVTTSVSVRSENSDSNALNNAASVTTAARNPADLRLTAVAPATAVAGDPFRYEVTVLNEGGAPATGVELTLPLPAGTTFDSLKQTAGLEATCTAPAAGQAGSVKCTIAELAGGASLTFGLAVRAAAAGEVRARFSVASASTDADAGDQAADVATAVAARPAPPAPPIVTPKPAPSDPCTSRRVFALRLIRRDLPGLRVNLKGARVRSAVLRTSGGRKVRKLRFAARRVRIDLRRLTPGRYAVRVRIRLRTGRTVTATARYRTCRAPS